MTDDSYKIANDRELIEMRRGAVEDLAEYRDNLAAIDAEIRQRGLEPRETVLHLTDSLKMLRETLCAVQNGAAGVDRMQHSERVGRIIAEIDRQRPLGSNGKHGDRHTATCGCKAVEPQAKPSDVQWIDDVETLALAQAAGHARMLEIGEGVGGLGVRNRAMFEDMLAWQDSSGNDHADTVLRLVAALRAAGGVR